MRRFYSSKTLAILFIAYMVSSGICGSIGRFSEIGRGHFSGKMGIYTAGDTLAFAYIPAETSSPDSYGAIVLRRSTDFGQNWTNKTFPNMVSNCQKPTLFWSPEEILVNYSSGTARKAASSSDHGTTWTTLNFGRTFEKSPYIEKRNGTYDIFSLDMMYPEYDQDSYSMQPDSEELVAPGMYLENIQASNGIHNQFNGMDDIYGIVYVQNYIGLYQDGTGWPTFHDKVIVGGQIDAQPDNINLENIFLGGYIENAPQIMLEPQTPSFDNAQTVGPADYDPNKILMVTVTGSSYEAMLGTISEPVLHYAWVYSPYPAIPLGDPLRRNVYAISDTVWTPLPGGNAIGTLYTPNKLWIKGKFSGDQTWCSGDTIFIIGDITLSGTPPGNDPSAEPQNLTDHVNLIAEKSIVLKYGYRDPIDSLRHYPNCRADSSPIEIYASLYALGDGQGNSHKDGVFTFEYQHPHPSTPDMYFGGELWTNIDLHRWTFPHSSANPWATRVDYPWYNPLWPEARPYLARGKVSVWGSMITKRRGYMRRMLNDFYFVPGVLWDPSIDACGGPSTEHVDDTVLGITLRNRNYPGCNGFYTGYKFKSHNDNRNSLSQSATLDGSHYLWKLGMSGGTWVYANTDSANVQPRFHKSQTRKTHSKAFTRRGENALYATNDLLIYDNGTETIDLSSLTTGHGLIESVALSNTGTALIYQYDAQGTGTMHIKIIDPEAGMTGTDLSIPTETKINDVAITPSGRKLVAKYAQSRIYFYEINSSNELVHINDCTFPVHEITPEALSNSRIYLSPTSNEILDIFLWVPYGTPAGENQPGTIYHARATNPSFADDPVAPELNSVSFKTYPNPMRDDLQVRMNIPKGVSHRVEIFNLRGQRVKTLANGTLSPEGDIGYVWNGSDEKGMLCGKGIYLIRLVIDNKPIRVKRICRI